MSNDTVPSTATVVDETPVKKPRLSRRVKIAIAAGAATIAAAVVVVVKTRSDENEADSVVFEPTDTKVEYLSDLDSSQS